MASPRPWIEAFAPATISNLAPGQVSMRFGYKGPSYTTTSACASGAHAIGEAARAIASGDVDAGELAHLFDKRLANTTPERAANIILEAVRKKKARVLVGPDAKVLDFIVRMTGSGYMNAFAGVTSRLMPSKP